MKQLPFVSAGHPALTAKEKPVVATLESGEQVTILHQKGCELYRVPGSPANFSGVADKSMPECCHFYMPLKGGRRLSLFVNTKTGLVTGSVGNEEAGVEFLREEFPEVIGAKGTGRRYILEPLEATG